MTLQYDIEQRAKVFDALSDPTRLRIVELLTQTAELSGSEIANRVDISLALFCHHSKTLIEAGLVQVRKEGQTKYHSLNRGFLTTCFASLGLEVNGEGEG
ncbi:ArsR/SmtB family transcription factor [Oscillatoria sp. FACHB-1407]|uniref:ArsR/SmtB family transcription factor n=1 Tax=Oscillatoria sp. FACHB-1407 TaxID=2692847 RepID=UPI0028165714|nr:metalloregulator ArsR/SmtB family transcription factor [Oscillatoria sp. FACHB-1407]